MKLSRGYVYITCAAVCWAISIIGTKYLLLHGENSYNVVFWLALLPIPYWFFVFSKRFNSLFTLKKKEYLVLLGIGLISGVLMPIVEVLAIRYSPAINYSLLIRSTVLFTVFFAVLFLKEKLSFKKVILVCLVLLGLFLLVTKGKMPTLTIGDTLTLVNAAAISFGNTILGKMAVKFTDGKFAASFQFIFGFIPIAIISLLNYGITVPKYFLLLLAMAIISIFGANFRFMSYKNASASKVAVVYTFTPVMVSFVAIPLFKESLSSIQLVGAVLILLTGVFADKLMKEN